MGCGNVAERSAGCKAPGDAALQKAGAIRILLQLTAKLPRNKVIDHVNGLQNLQGMGAGAGWFGVLVLFGWMLFVQ
jgi:hypothetical protein